MQPVVDVAARREREAASQLGEGQARRQQAEQRLQDLIAYRDEYSRQFDAAGSVNAVRLRDYRIFLDRLNQAIEQQRGLCARAAADCEALRLRWLEVHGRAQALDKVVSRYQAEERDCDARREQQESDQQNQTRRPRPEEG